MGNDVLFFERRLKPYTPLFFYTNAGSLMACPEGIYFSSAQDAYDRYFKSLSIPASENGFNRFCSLSSLGTFLWYILKNQNLVDFRHAVFDSYTKKVEANWSPKPRDGEIREIKTLCEKNGSRFILSVFPDISSFGQWITPKDFPGLFSDIPYHMASFKKSDYDLKSNHLNDEGNKKYAAYLDSLIREGK
jgi:hypothetical protein